MGDFVDAIGRGIGGLVADALNVIGGIVSGILGFLGIFLPGPILGVVLAGLAFAGVMWFLFKR
jgi:hypothetical protein